ncbi:hypothetical protein EUX98_g6256 [Antrodiella citrinella]|uniref:Uncharacterized protein n=1 Tax=Antrodiella citrinella TaxID=2447956 RepID=A0A4S4MPK8_9APHY|nr:hypothetical protein EUX98_g6256 [Antrodiella citrinella]
MPLRLSLIRTLSQPFYGTHEEFFAHITAHLEYARLQRNSEWALYGYINFVFTMFCSSATVTQDRGDGDDVHHHLGCFSQMQLKPVKEGDVAAADLFRIPDFVAVVFHRLVTGSIGGHPAFLVEVKRASWVGRPWFGLPQDVAEVPLPEEFLKHLPQLLQQAKCCKRVNPVNHDKVYGFLIIDVWFVLFELGSFIRSTRNNQPVDQNDLNTVHATLLKYCRVPPTPIFDTDYKNFNPPFLEALKIATEEYPLTIAAHPYFLPPPQFEATASANEAQLDAFVDMISRAASLGKSEQYDLATANGDFSMSQPDEDDDGHAEVKVEAEVIGDEDNWEDSETDGVKVKAGKGKGRAQPKNQGRSRQRPAARDIYKGPDLPLDIVHSRSPVKTRKRAPAKPTADQPLPSASRQTSPSKGRFAPPPGSNNPRAYIHRPE